MVTAPKVLILIPAFNEEASLPALLAELGGRHPILVVDDGSRDRTSDVARLHGAEVLRLPCNLGVGGAVQAGCAYAWQEGFDLLIRVDADGQHPPAAVDSLLRAMRQRDDDMVTASRFLSDENEYQTRGVRLWGIRWLAWFLSRICKRPITDPTSGCFAIRRRLIYYFANRYPTDYPEPEALALIARQGYLSSEIGIPFRERAAGVSSIRGWGTLYYILKVGLALVVDRARSVDPHFQKETLAWIREVPGG